MGSRDREFIQRQRLCLLIAREMKDSGIKDVLIREAVEYGTQHQPTFNLLLMWSQESNPKSRSEILSLIEEEVEKQKFPDTRSVLKDC